VSSDVLLRVSAATKPCAGYLRSAFAPIFVAGVPFAAYAVLVLHHFYLSGAFYYDTGMLGFLMTRGGPALRLPSVDLGASFLAIHVAPLLAICSALAAILPLTMPQFMSGFEGACHAVPPLAVYWVLTARYGMRSTGAALAAAVIAISFGFNGLALAIARYPHFELLIAAAIIVFSVLFDGGRSRWAALPFAVGLATREDAGFHFCAVLAVMLTLDWWYGQHRERRRAALIFAAAGFAYSASALGFQHLAFPGTSSLSRIYLGDPPFANITTRLVSERLYGYLIDRSYIALPALFAAGWAALAGNPYIAAGYIAFLPWVALHLLADSAIAGSLSGYYAFPLLVAMFWPLIGARCGPRGGGAPAASVLAFAMMIALSATALPRQYNPGHLDLPGSLFTPPSLERQQATDRALRALLLRKETLGPLVVDASILALAPDGFAKNEAIAFAGGGRPRTVIYFAGGYEARHAAAIAAANGLGRVYAIPGTAIRLATTLAPEALTLGVPLIPVAASPPR
jgi:hypothetical protein